MSYTSVIRQLKSNTYIYIYIILVIYYRERELVVCFYLMSRRTSFSRATTSATWKREPDPYDYHMIIMIMIMIVLLIISSSSIIMITIIIIITTTTTTTTITITSVSRTRSPCRPLMVVYPRRFADVALFSNTLIRLGTSSVTILHFNGPLAYES